jgi:hypothetical protein
LHFLKTLHIQISVFTPKNALFADFPLFLF